MKSVHTTLVLVTASPSLVSSLEFASKTVEFNLKYLSASAAIEGIRGAVSGKTLISLTIRYAHRIISPNEMVSEQK